MSEGNVFDTSLERESLVCARCGYCRNACPVYRVIGWESATPRGKISLARQAYAHDRPELLSGEFLHRLSQCTLCGACSSECSTDIETRRLWIEMRQRAASMGKAPEGYIKLQSNLNATGNITTNANSERLDWAEDLDDADRLQPRAGADACYFVGCVSSFYPQASEIAVALSEILSFAGVDYTTMGGDEYCCGFPSMAAGFGEDGRRFIKHNVDRIRSLDIHALIVNCPSCLHVWKHYSPEFLGEYHLDVFHSTEYIERLIREERIHLKNMDARIAYHDPCDLGRQGGIFEPPRNIIQSIPGVTLVELRNNRHKSFCCGGGGNLQGVDPELTGEIAALRVRDIKDSGANILVSACQQCEKILRMALRKEELPVRVLDISQLVLKVMDQSAHVR